MPTNDSTTQEDEGLALERAKLSSQRREATDIIKRTTAVLLEVEAALKERQRLRSEATS